MDALRHGYTNDTRGDGTVVVKRYQGPASGRRRERERAALVALRGRLPVPEVLGVDGEALVMSFLPGVHGQDLIEQGYAGPVLRSCGTMLRSVHASALVHGDYGPNNMLFDPETFEVTGILDWEWAHPGAAVEDLAWCEWIVRMHHSRHIDALAGFFDGYGDRPLWTRRRATMLDRCVELRELCREWDAPAAVREWQRRYEVTAGWTSLSGE
jgi:tRNA A-37 threonylcarbamoyl transferase component Bud32